MKDLFFDLDHTLWDFEKNSREALAEGYDFIDLTSFGVSSFEDYLQEYEKAITSIEQALKFYPSFKSRELITEIERLIKEDSI